MCVSFFFFFFFSKSALRLPSTSLCLTKFNHKFCCHLRVAACGATHDQQRISMINDRMISLGVCLMAIVIHIHICHRQHGLDSPLSLQFSAEQSNTPHPQNATRLWVTNPTLEFYLIPSFFFCIPSSPLTKHDHDLFARHGRVLSSFCVGWLSSSSSKSVNSQQSQHQHNNHIYGVETHYA